MSTGKPSRSASAPKTAAKPKPIPAPASKQTKAPAAKPAPAKSLPKPIAKPTPKPMPPSAKPAAKPAKPIAKTASKPAPVLAKDQPKPIAKPASAKPSKPVAKAAHAPAKPVPPKAKIETTSSRTAKPAPVPTKPAVNPTPALAKAAVETPSTPDGTTPRQTNHVLIVTLGKTPNIITNLIWGMAKCGWKGQKPLIPSRIEVIATGSNKDKFMEEVVNGGVWKELLEDLEQLCKVPSIDLPIKFHALERTQNNIQVAVDDLITDEDVNAVSDIILQRLRECANAPIIAYIAGGRKSLGALLYGAMTLGGKIDDRILHLIAQGYGEDGGGEGRAPHDFYYSGQKRPIRTHNRSWKRDLKPSDIRECISELPFVPMAEYFGTKLDNLSFTGMAAKARRLFNKTAHIEVTLEGNTLTVEGIDTDLGEWIGITPIRNPGAIADSQNPAQKNNANHKAWRHILQHFIAHPGTREEYRTLKRDSSICTVLTNAGCSLPPDEKPNNRKWSYVEPETGKRIGTFSEASVAQMFAGVRQGLIKTGVPKPIVNAVLPRLGSDRTSTRAIRFNGVDIFTPPAAAKS